MTRHEKLTIQTAEGVHFSYELASPATRLMAYCIDFIVIGILVGAFSILAGFLALISPGLAFAASIIGYFLTATLYGMLLEWFNKGQTIGKKVLNLRVIDASGLKMRFPQIAIRNLLRLVDSLPVLYLLGGVTSMLTRHCQRLGDIAANTVVIRHTSYRQPDVQGVMAGKYNSFRDYPHLEARLRQAVTPEEAHLALRALIRRKGLNADDRIELFEEFANHFKSVAHFPEEVTKNLTGEQYIRNAVDSIYRGKKME